MKNVSLLMIMLAVMFTVLTGRFEYIPGEYSSFEWKFLEMRLLKIGGGSEQMYVSTALVGYLFILVFAFMNLSRAKVMGFPKSMGWLLGITLFAFLFELSGYFLLYYGMFHGTHVQIGLVLAMWSLWLTDRLYNGVRRKR